MRRGGNNNQGMMRNNNNMSLANIANLGMLGGAGLRNQQVNGGRMQPGRAALARQRNNNAYRVGGAANANRLRRAQGVRGPANVRRCRHRRLVANQPAFKAHRPSEPQPRKRQQQVGWGPTKWCCPAKQGESVSKRRQCSRRQDSRRQVQKYRLEQEKQSKWRLERQQQPAAKRC